MTDEDRPDPELATLVEELRGTLDELEGALDGGARDGQRRDRQRGATPPGRPTPPDPRDLLRFTEQYTIPTLLALLDAATRALELLQATLRLVDGRGVPRGDSEGRTAARVGSVGRTTLDRVDAALRELSAAVEGEPADDEVSALLGQARSLREEVDERLRAAERGEYGSERSESAQERPRTPSGSAHEIPVRPEGGQDEEPGTDDRSSGGATLDADEEDDEDEVEDELASIRNEVERERDRSEEWEAQYEDDGEEASDCEGEDQVGEEGDDGANR